VGAKAISTGQTIQTAAIWAGRPERDVSLLDEEWRTGIGGVRAWSEYKFIEQHQNKLPIEFTMLEIQNRNRGGPAEFAGDCGDICTRH